MTDLDRAFRDVERMPVTDLWPDIRSRQPRPPVPAPQGRRAAIVIVALALAAIGFVALVRAFSGPTAPRPHGGPAGQHSIQHNGSGPSAFPQMTGTATERKLCSDLLNGDPTATLYKDTMRVSRDKATIPDHLGIAAATFITVTTRPRELLPGSFDSFRTYCSGGPSGGAPTTRTATEKKLCSDLRNGASRPYGRLWNDANRVTNDMAADSHPLGKDALIFMISVSNGPPPGEQMIRKEIARLKTDCGI